MTPEERQQSLRRRMIAARMSAAQAQKTTTDPLGFPAAPQGGVSTDSQAIDEFRPKMGAAFDGLVQGATFGMHDEFRGLSDGAFGGISDAISGQESRGMGERYTTGRDEVRARNAASQSAEPLAFGGGQVMGAMLPALAAAPMTGGGSIAGTAGRGMALGAVEGGLHGLGNADGVDPLKSTVKGAALGGLVGGAAPLAVGAAAGIKRAASDPVTGLIEGMLNKANPNKANRAVSKAMRASKKTPAQITQEMAAAKAAGQPEFSLMDAMGTSGQRLASGVSRGGGDAGAEIAEYLASRQSGQAERVGSFVDDAFGMGGGTAKGKVDELTAARSTNANAAYDAARTDAGPVDVRGALGAIDQRIGGMQGSNVTGDAIDGKLAGYRQRLAADPAPNGELSRELSDFDRVLGVKQSVQDDIGAAVRAGRNNEARELGKLTAELDAALESASPTYRTANDGFREASGVIDAVDQGAMLSRPSMRADDAAGQFGAMTPDQQGAARVGYGDKLLAQIEANTAPTSNKAKALQSPKRDAEATAMAIDPAQYKDRLARENTMWQTQNRATGGSMTADNLEDISNISGAAEGAGGVAQSALNFQFGDAASKVMGLLGPMAKGQSDATRKLIAQALMSGDPQKALAPILRQEMTGGKKRRAIEALLRNSGRGSASQEIAPQPN